MIQLSRLHGAGTIVVNADLIETMEACPDVTITLVTKRRFVVADSLEEVIERIVAYRRSVSATYPTTVLNATHPNVDQVSDDERRVA
jgi:flagellar protein FlbD